MLTADIVRKGMRGDTREMVRVAMITAISDEDALELLATWWRHEANWTPVEGFPKECPSTRGWRSSRQWDDANGALDGDHDHRVAVYVGHVISTIGEPCRSALYVMARNRVVGVQVFDSPRLPADTRARELVMQDAIDKFRAAL